jgi:sialic acid synthase SpsE
MKEFKVNEISIAGRKVGPNYPPLVIAEIGINHNGSLLEAKKLVDAAAGAGIEVIKHQTHVVEDEMSAEAKKVIPGNSDKSIYEIMAECALSEEDEFELKSYVEKKGLIFISTPFSRAAAERLKLMNIPAYKIGSGECNNLPLIDHISDFGKPMIISTGMNTIDSIRETVSLLRSKETKFALLHTTNLYPTPDRLVRLGGMTQLMQEFPDTVIGLSDHTITNHACFGAVALGASILERHFTDSMSREGPDIVCSMDPKNASDLIKGSKIIFDQRGGEKGPAKEEQVTIDFAFATVVAIQDISQGEVLTRDNIWVKRPGTGEILAAEYKDLLGKKAKQKILSDSHLKRSDIQH